MITQKLKNWLCGKIKRMLWLITQRGVVKQLHRLRWKRGVEKTNLAFVYKGWEVKRLGIKQDDFTSELFRREFFDNGILGFLKGIYRKIRKEYTEIFDYKLDDVIERCIKNGYIEKDNSSSGYLKETEDGEKLISFWYYPKKFINQPLIIKIIEICLGFLLGYIVAKYKINL